MWSECMNNGLLTHAIETRKSENVERYNRARYSQISGEQEFEFIGKQRGK